MPPPLVPKTHRSRTYPHTASTGALGNSKATWENGSSTLERALTPEGTLTPNS